MTEGRRTVELRLELPSDEAAAELERALLRAKASELTEARRRTVRFSTGYGDDTTRDVLVDESRRAQLRHDLLGDLLDELRRAIGDRG